MATFNSTGLGGDWELTATWAEAGFPVAGDTVTITSGDIVTLTQNEAFGSCGVAGTLVVGAHTLAGSGSGDGHIHGAGEITLTTGTITTSGQDYKPALTTITGNATITANQKLGGEFDIQGAAAPTITARGSQGGLNISADGESTVNFVQSEAGVLENAGTFYNLNISGAHTMTQNNAVTVANDLTIASGTTVTTSGSNYALTVDGDVSVTGTLTGNASAISMGSLTIPSGGTYSATSGTTTIKSATGTSSNTYSNSGNADPKVSFVHNNGKLFFDLSVANGAGYHNILNSSTAGLHTFYDFEIKCDSEYVAMMKSIEVLGNYTVRGSNAIRYESGNATNSLIVHGLATTSNSQLGSSDTTGIDTGIPVEKRGWQFLGGLDVTGGTFKLGSNQTVKVSGLRNLGGTIT